MTIQAGWLGIASSNCSSGEAGFSLESESFGLDGVDPAAADAAVSGEDQSALLNTYIKAPVRVFCDFTGTSPLTKVGSVE